MRSIEERLERIDGRLGAYRLSRRLEGSPLCIRLMPGDPDPVIPEGARPLIIDCRHSQRPIDSRPPSVASVDRAV